MLLHLMEYRKKGQAQYEDKGIPMPLRLQIIRMAGKPYLVSNYIWMKLATGRGLFFDFIFRKKFIQWESGITLSTGEKHREKF